MVELLDLPNEILEIILRRVVRDVGPLMSSQPSCYGSGLDKLQIVLPLRLVCRMFRDLADPFIFETIACMVSHKRDPRDSGKTKSGIFQLLATNASIGGSVKEISFEGEHGEGTRQSPRFRERIGKTLRYAHTKLEIMTWERYDDYDPIPIPFYTEIFTQGFPKLRYVSLVDISLLFCFPEISAAAPLLEDLQIGGQCILSYEAVQSLVTKMTLPALVKGSAAQPLHSIRVVDFGSDCLCCFLTNIRPYAQSLTIGTNRLPWQSNTDQQLAALSYQGDDNGSLIAFDIDHFDIYDEPDWYSDPGHTASDIVLEYMEEAAPQRLQLFDRLKESWRGKGIRMAMPKPIGDWRLHTVDDDTTTISEVVEELWETS